MRKARRRKRRNPHNPSAFVWAIGGAVVLAVGTVAVIVWRRTSDVAALSSDVDVPQEFLRQLQAAV